jgi:hypothetical protein
MSALIFGDKVLYTASKIAGTTVRLWVVNAISAYIIQTKGKGNHPPASNAELDALAATLPRPLSLDVLKSTGASVDQVAQAIAELRVSYHFGFFAPLDCRHRYCITRDPVSRFISCISQKLGKEKFIAIRDTQHLIDNFDDLCLKPLSQISSEFSFNEQWENWQKIIVPRHFAPQYYSFGNNIDYFTQTFDISEVNTLVRQLLSAHFNQNIPARVANKGQKILPLTSTQISAVEKIYKQDYNCGYC